MSKARKRPGGTKPANHTLTLNLREDFAPGASGTLAVDRDAGLIKGVKILGRTSPNRHGLDGISGTEYTTDALERAAPLYEGLSVNVDHPPRQTPGKERSSRDRIGWLTGVHTRADGLYGDLNLLKSDPLTEKLFEAAERNPRLFGLSHNACGKGEVRAGKYVVTEIPEVRSVDVVADAGTTRSLFESKEAPTMKKTFRQVLESLADAKRKAPFLALLEMDDLGDVPVMDADPAAVAGDFKADLVAAIGKLVQSEDAEDHKLAQKIMAMLKPAGATETATETTTTEESEEDDAAEEKGKTEADTKESRELRELRAEKGVRQLCESLEFHPTQLQVEALVGLKTDKARKDLIGQFKQPAKARVAPRTGGGVRPVQESAEAAPAKDAKDFATRLLRG